MTDPDTDYRHDLDWSEVPEKKAKQIFDLGQAHLAAQLQTALAADARATAWAGLCITLALAILAAGLAHFQSAKDWSILGGAITAASFFLVAGGRAAWAARPVPFYLPGTYPEKWFVSLSDDLPTLLGGQAELDDRDIRRNERQLAANASVVAEAYGIAIAAPVIAFVVWLLIDLFFE